MPSQSNFAPGIAHLINCLPEEPAEALRNLPRGSWEELEELRFLVRQPVMVYCRTEGTVSHAFRRIDFLYFGSCHYHRRTNSKHISRTL